VFHSLRARLFITYLLVSGVALILVAASLVFLLLRNPVAERLEYRWLNFWLDRYAEREGSGLLSLETDRLPAIIQRVDQASRARSLLLGPDGEVLADSRPGESPLPADVLSKVAASPNPTQGQFRFPTGGQWLYVSSRLGKERWLILAAPRPGVRALGLWGNELLMPVIQAGAVSLLLSAILAWLIARWVAAPLGRAAEAARSVAAGNYDHQLLPSGPAEAQSMALAFNEMMDRVQASKLAQRDFVANVSHELKTPLTSIQGFAQAILDGTADDAQSQRHAAQVIYDETDRLRRLVEDLLDLARIDAGQISFERRPMDLGALMGAVVERLSVRAGERSVRIETHLPVLPTVIGDGDRLAQVFTNLLDNAIKHTPEGSHVALKGEVEAGWVSIHVDDTGPGIPEDELSRIFERFYQLDKARSGGRGRGVGLGLAISREIVQAHGGRLVAQSVIGRGSRFTVQLPIIRPDDKTLARPST
jgi:two-component system OmpR family sensor kinase